MFSFELFLESVRIWLCNRDIKHHEAKAEKWMLRYQKAFDSYYKKWGTQHGYHGQAKIDKSAFIWVTHEESLQKMLSLPDVTPGKGISSKAAALRRQRLCTLVEKAA